MYTLLMKSSTGPRRQWALGERHLVIGRGRDCDLVVFDPLVSRRHCELWIEEDKVLFQDLGSANPTLVNGNGRRGGVLDLGDELKIGDHTFLVGEADEAALAAGRYDDGATPKTVSVEDTPFFSSRSKDEAVGANAGGFKSLMQCARRFSRAEVLSELCESLLEILRTELESGSTWIVLFRGEGAEAAVRAESGAAEIPLPGEALAQVRRQRRGVLAPMRGRDGAPAIVMAAPMLIDGDLFGAVAAVVPAERANVTDDGPLHYFVALIHSFTPFYRSLERKEQTARDMERVTWAADVSGMLIGRSAAMSALRTLIERVAGSELNVLLLGETGSGKELASRLIHNLSARSERPYVVVNCPAVPGELFESVMFGHRKGSFTGANEHREGYFAEAQGGTLFLDEIGDLPLEFQARLLRVVETRCYRPIGAARDVTADVRIVAATNRPVGGTNGDSAVRSDLFHRLAGFEIRLPPLRERREDIADLAEYFLSDCLSAGRSRAKYFSPAALKRLQKWDWPGNVRELKLCVERAGVLAQSETISESDVMLWRAEETSADVPPANTPLVEIERWHLERAFRHCDENISATAVMLGISRSTAYEKLRQFGMNA